MRDGSFLARRQENAQNRIRPTVGTGGKAYAPEMNRTPDLGQPIVNFGAEPRPYYGKRDTVENVIQGKTDTALGILDQGSQEQLRLSQLAMQAGLEPFQNIDIRALREQNALLGLSGQEAQEQAIGNIPVSEFDKELYARQQKGLMRQANAGGEARSGSTFEALAQLGGAQQMDMIQRRLAQLEPLVALARTSGSYASDVTERGLADQAQITSGLGTQLASARMGTVTPQINGIMNNAEISGLKGIAAAQQRGQIAGQLANLAGTALQAYGR